MPNYMVGTIDPKPIIDAGSGEWCSEGSGKSLVRWSKDKEYIDAMVDLLSFTSNVVPDAYHHLKHYFENTGEDLHLNMTDIMNKSEQLRKYHDKELQEAKTFCETLPASEIPYNIVSSNIQHGDFSDKKNRNLFYAIGGYQYWGRGVVKITEIDEAGGNNSELKDVVENYYRQVRRKYELKFTFIFFDRYNWNIDKGQGIGFGIRASDKFMVKYHKKCFGKEYNIWGRLETNVPIWEDE